MRTDKLNYLSACHDAIEYVKSQPSAVAAWTNCARGDWMLWLAKRLNVDDKALVMAKAMCAKQVEHLMKDQRSLDALQACFDYVHGKITKEELQIAAADADAANADADAANAAADAAYAAANAAADAAYAVDAAADAAYAAYAAARINSLQKSADICREYLTEEVLKNYKSLKIK